MGQASRSVSLSPQRHMAWTRTYLPLLKLRIVVPLMAVAAITAIVADHGVVPLRTLVFLVLAGGLASAGSACLNHYLDRDIDALMERTCYRPLPAGQIRNPLSVLLLGISLLGVAMLAATRLTSMSAAFVALGAVFYVVVYTWTLKRSTPLNVVIGGFAGSCASLAGWFSVNPEVSLTPILLGLLVFLWTPSHFWSLAAALREDYGRAHVPMLPVFLESRTMALIIACNTVLTVALSLVPGYLGIFGLPYLTVAAMSGFLALRTNVGLVLSPTREQAWRAYKLSGMYLGLLFVGMLIDTIATRGL